MSSNSTAATYSLRTISGRAVRLPITERQYQDLMLHLLKRLGTTACDNTLRLAEDWARSRGAAWAALQRSLQAGSGYCDCEVTLNVVDESFYGTAELGPDECLGFCEWDDHDS